MSRIGLQQITREPQKVVLQPLFVERDVRQLEEVVLEVVQIPEDRLQVERAARIRDRVIDDAATLDLEPWQHLHDATIERQHGSGKRRAWLLLARLDERVEER